MAVCRMDWKALVCAYRFDRDLNVAEPDLEPGRTPFSKDQDKIVFSSSFRRLSKKTQVHPMVNNDHIHTRLTHSIEVASVGRTIGNIVGAYVQKEHHCDISAHHFGEIVQAACLAHDIGNPPFGHAGEAAIQDWFTKRHGELLSSDSGDGKLSSQQLLDFKAFDGNAMGFRVVTQNEYDSSKGGMRLSFPTLAAMLKYPWTSSKTEEKGKKKFCCLSSEVEVMTQICETLGMIKLGDNCWARHPLVYLVEAADDICYNLLDLEDAMEMRLVTIDDFRTICDPLHANDDNYEAYLDSNLSPRRKISYVRGKTIHKLIKCVVDAFKENYDLIMLGEFSGNLVKSSTSVCRDLVSYANELCTDKVYKHHRKIELEIGSYNAIGSMLDAFYYAAKQVHNCNGRPISFKAERIMDLLGVRRPREGASLYDIMLPFVDYLSGMTDNFATHISRQIQGQAAQDISR